MGGPQKALVRLGGRTLLDRAVAALGPQVTRLAVSWNGDPADLAGLAPDVIADAPAAGGRQGPLAGVIAGLRWAGARGARLLATAPVDAPFLPAGWVAALAAEAGPGPVLARSSAGRVHPVVALWPVSCLAALEADFAAGTRGVMAAADRLGGRPATLEAPEEAFMNVNTPEDLRRAEAMLGRRD